jgi:hypothetical protein
MVLRTNVIGDYIQGHLNKVPSFGDSRRYEGSRLTGSRVRAISTPFIRSRPRGFLTNRGHKISATGGTVAALASRRSLYAKSYSIATFGLVHVSPPQYRVDSACPAGLIIETAATNRERW